MDFLEKGVRIPYSQLTDHQVFAKSEIVVDVPQQDPINLGQSPLSSFPSSSPHSQSKNSYYKTPVNSLEVKTSDQHAIIDLSTPQSPFASSPGEFNFHPVRLDETPPTPPSRETFSQPKSSHPSEMHVPSPTPKAKELVLSPFEHPVINTSISNTSNTPQCSELTPLNHQTNHTKSMNYNNALSDQVQSLQAVVDSTRRIITESGSPTVLANPYQQIIIEPHLKSNFSNLNISTLDPLTAKPNGLNGHLHMPDAHKNPLGLNSPSSTNPNGVPPSPKHPGLTCSPPYVKMPPPPPIAAHNKSRGRWIRPLGYAERFMSSAHEFGCMTTVYAIWLDSRQPVPFALIRKAAAIIYRKMPHLRVAIGHHQGERWWREMETEKLDVEEMKTDNVMSTIEELLKRRFRIEEGPLWFTRFVTLQQDNGGNMPDSNESLKFKYACLFGFHHNVTDGTTNMKFSKIFLQVLNDMLQEKDIDMKEEGTFSEPLHDRLADAVSSRWKLLRIFLRRFYKGILSYGAFVRNFTRHYHMPAQNSASTKVLHYELDEAITQRILERCKKEGVTLNSVFITAANLALYEMMMAKNPSLGASAVNSLQAINMRRYWPKDKQANSFGSHISMLDISFMIKKEHFKCFWDCARLVHASLGHQLNKVRHPLVVQPISERLLFIIYSNSFLNRFKLPSTNDNHYCVTNMGDLSTTFPGTGPEVEASRVIRSVSAHLMPSLCQHTIHTFRGRLSYSIDYYTQKLTKETASAYSKKVVDILKYSITSPK